MLKKIAALRLRQQLGEVLNAVHFLGDEYIVERNGKPLAAVVPVGIAIKREQAKKNLLEMMKRKTAFDAMGEEEFDKMIDREVQAVRRRRRQSQRKTAKKRTS
jgi:antitoxin (DNA-binding transcriptional repressor) of toxin-antitoxin stability system